ncbi:MAG: succinate dehydrogenase, hydrophobic membrane anchor protein [Cucumibacter sp.]
MDKRTPTGFLGLASAKGGTDHFVQQRLTAAANVPLILFFVWLVLSHVGAGRAELVATLANPVVAAAAILAIASIAWHMRIGMQVVIEDYVSSQAAKVLLALNNLFSLAVAAVAILSVLWLGFGG